MKNRSGARKGEAGSKNKKKEVKTTKKRKEELIGRISSGTYDSWLEAEQKRGPVKKKSGPKPEVLPIDTLQEWLSKQEPVSEKEERIEVALPLGSTEEWIEKQVSERLAKEKSEEESLLAATK